MHLLVNYGKHDESTKFIKCTARIIKYEKNKFSFIRTTESYHDRSDWL